MARQYADDFLGGYERAHDFLRRMDRERGLADVEKAKVEETGDSYEVYEPPGLGDVGQNEGKGYGRLDAVAGMEPATAIDNSPGGVRQMGTRKYNLLGQTFDSRPTAEQERDARAAKRASILRAHGGLLKDANDEVTGNQQIGLNDLTAQKKRQDIAGGVYDLEAKGLALKSAHRKERADSTVEQVENEIADYVRSSQVDPLSVSGASDIAAKHVAAFASRGMTQEAAKAAESYAKTLTSQLTSTKARRGEAALGVEQALQSGDAKALEKALFDLDTLLPNGGKVLSVKAAGPGKYIVTREDGGKVNQKPVTTEQLRQMLDMVAGTDFDKTAQEVIKARLEQSKIKAQTTQALAAAGNSSAAAEEHRSRTDKNKYEFGRQKSLDAALDVPEVDRTLNQQSRISAERERGTIERESKPSRSGRSHSQRATSRETQTGGMLIYKADGSVWERGRNDTAFKEVTLGGPVKGATPPTPEEVSDAVREPGGSPSTQSKGKLPPVSQRVIGEIYTNDAGTEARWTARGLEEVLKK